MLALTVACVAAVAIAVLGRIARARAASGGLRAGATALSVATPIGIAIFALAGPLAHGWARRAGTPLRLLGAPATASHPAAAPGAATTAKGPLDRAFSATLSGNVSQSTASGGAIVELQLRLGGGANGQMRVRMGGSPLPGGGLSMTGSQVALTASGMPSALVGRILSLSGTRFVARVSDTSGSVVDLNANLTIDGNSGAVTGTLSGNPVASAKAG
jgi:hypothetical protein